MGSNGAASLTRHSWHQSAQLARYFASPPVFEQAPFPESHFLDVAMNMESRKGVNPGHQWTPMAAEPTNSSALQQAKTASDVLKAFIRPLW